MLDDTTIREFLRDDYPAIVDAVTLVTGDGQVAEKAVRDALLLAWTQSEAGEPIDALDHWIIRAALHAPRKGMRRLGADRRARALLGGAATDDGADVWPALARLSWRQREVAVVRYLLRETPRETADTLGLRERTVERALSEAQASLSAALLPPEERPDDEALTERFQRVARHRQADPQLFERLVASMTRRETTRRARTVVAVVMVVAVGAGFVALTERSQSDQASPSPTGGSRIPADAAALPGVPFPACHVSVTHSFTPSSGWFGVVYLFGKGSPTVPCLKLGSTPTYIAIDTGGAGRPKDVVVFGPIRCEFACRAFATADIDGDGWAELGVVAADRPDADTIELYRVRPDAPTPLRPMTTVVAGASVPFSFQWGGAGASRSGATCPDTAGAAATDLDVWHAMRRGGAWHLRETFYAVHGASVTKVGGKRSLVTREDGLPEWRDFCGMPVGF